MASSADLSKPPGGIVRGFRLVAPRWADGAFSGEGARRFGGRWNSPGRPVVYLAESRALAALELLVHLTTPLSRRKPYRMIEIHLPASCVVDYPASLLPGDWRRSPPGNGTTDIGDDWYDAGSQLALRVPSAVVPEEGNFLVNPRHPDFPKTRIFPPAPFGYDARLHA